MKIVVMASYTPNGKGYCFLSKSPRAKGEIAHIVNSFGSLRPVYVQACGERTDEQCAAYQHKTGFSNWCWLEEER